MPTPKPVKGGASDTPLSRLREIVQEMVDAGDSQSDIAKRLGLSQPTISGWLTEERLDPRASALGVVAQKLGINGHWLLTGQGSRRVDDSATAVFADGVRAGLHRAELAVRALRATSGGIDAEQSAFEKMAVRTAVREEAKAAPRPRRAGGSTPR
jgi:transcriptional regulator with XRE-family HTH domain